MLYWEVLLIFCLHLLHTWEKHTPFNITHSSIITPPTLTSITIIKHLYYLSDSVNKRWKTIRSVKVVLTAELLYCGHIKWEVRVFLTFINLSLVCWIQKYAPSVFEKYVSTISLGGKEIRLNLYDTAGKTQLHVETLMINDLLPVLSISCNVKRQ